ncbi:N-acetyltransferase family protein [Blastomonas fulva]|uniref:GNAT family N-acetyltransferase n=1 Tax=Blastomonas fulva TaxID=1550728 RepID=UPI003D290076
MTTRTGFCFSVRPAQAADEVALGAFFAHVTPEDLRFRFLTGLQTVAHDTLVAMTDIDHQKTENFLAFVDGEAQIIATAMLACDPEMQTGEVAIVIRPEYRGKGVSWDLLHHLTEYARAKGLTTIQSIEDRGSHASIDMEREMGFTATSYPGDATLMLLQKDLTTR